MTIYTVYFTPSVLSKETIQSFLMPKKNLLAKGKDPRGAAHLQSLYAGPHNAINPYFSRS